MSFDFEKHIGSYRDVGYYLEDEGASYIVWRRGTGGNVEILHLKTKERRKGTGTRLFRKMLEELKSHPPYASVYVFTRESNTDADLFYASMGLTYNFVKGVYADGTAVLYSGKYEELRKIHNV